MEGTFLDSKANDMFSKFNNSDLKYLLNEIERYYIEQALVYLKILHLG